MKKIVLTVNQRKILVGIHFEKKTDLFDFPGVPPKDFDKLHSAGLICGGYRNGFALSRKGATLAAKEDPALSAS